MGIKVENHLFRKNGSTYPWDQWLDGGTWRLRIGEDFKCTPTSFVSAAYQTASRRGMKIQVDKSEQGFLFLRAFAVKS